MTTLDRRDLVVRAVRAIGAIAVLYSFLYYLLPATTGVDLVALLNVTLASASAMLMNTIGFAVIQSDTLLTLRGASVVVTNDCNGLGAWLLVVGAMSAMPAVSWPWRAAGMAASAVALTAVNVTRIDLNTACWLGWPGQQSRGGGVDAAPARTRRPQTPTARRFTATRQT